MKPIHLADYYDCQTENQGSLGEGGGPQIPRQEGLPTISQSSDNNLEQESSNVDPPVASPVEAESLVAEQVNSSYNFNKSLKDLLRNFVDIDF